MDFYEQPSILGAMQFCRYFTTNAGLALLHKATGADKQQQRLARSSSSSTASTQLDPSVQQQLLRPFTLVVDSKGTGHVATLQAALDMAAMAAAQRAQQHYSSGSSSSASVPADATDTSSVTSCKRRSSVEMRPAAADGSRASDADVQTSCNRTISSSTCDSAAACDNLLIVLLPGTHPGSYALPGSVGHITIAGVPGCRTLLCEKGSDQLGAVSTTTNSSTGFLQQQQHNLQELDARMLRLQLAQRQAAAAASPGQLLRCSSASAVQQQQEQGQGPACPAAACLLSCPFGVESLKLQHLQLELAGAAGKHGAAQCQRVLMRQESAPAASMSSIGAVRGAGATGGTSRLGSRSSSSKKGGEASGVEVRDDEPYCIRLCSGSELRMEWCEFSGGAGGVLSEAGAMVAAMQCSFHQ
jgi:hypothetical protein